MIILFVWYSKKWRWWCCDVTCGTLVRCCTVMAVWWTLCNSVFGERYPLQCLVIFILARPILQLVWWSVGTAVFGNLYFGLVVSVWWTVIMHFSVWWTVVTVQCTVFGEHYALQFWVIWTWTSISVWQTVAMHFSVGEDRVTMHKKCQCLVSRIHCSTVHDLYILQWLMNMHFSVWWTVWTSVFGSLHILQLVICLCTVDDL